MQWGTRLARLGMLGIVGLAVALAAGCNQQQLEERNVALEKQLKQALEQNANLQAENDTLKSQNAAVQGDLDKTRAQLAAQKGGPPMPVRPARGAPTIEGAESAVVGESTVITLPETVLFESGKDVLKASAKKALDHIAAVLNKDYAHDKVRVEGHTDSQPITKSKGKWEDNLDLSCNRAMEVTRYLTSKGLDPKRIYAAGYGANKPIASNATVAGRAKNRRVTIVVYP